MVVIRMFFLDNVNAGGGKNKVDLGDVYSGGGGSNDGAGDVDVGGDDGSCGDGDIKVDVWDDLDGTNGNSYDDGVVTLIMVMMLTVVMAIAKLIAI